MDKIVNDIYGIATHSIISNLHYITNSRLKIDHPVVPSKEQAALIMELNINQQHLLIARSTSFLKIELDKGLLSREIREVHQKATAHEMETLFLKLGAPHVLMKRLFGMHPTEFSFRRNLLNLYQQGSGRTSSCDDATQHKIWEYWFSMENLEERQRFLKLWELTQVDMHVIWTVVQPFIDSSKNT